MILRISSYAEMKLVSKLGKVMQITQSNIAHNSEKKYQHFEVFVHKFN